MRASSTGVVGIKRSERRRIRVLEIVGNAIVGGMESTVYDLIRFLSPDEFEVTCVCPYERGSNNPFDDLGDAGDQRRPARGKSSHHGLPSDIRTGFGGGGCGRQYFDHSQRHRCRSFPSGSQCNCVSRGDEDSAERPINRVCWTSLAGKGADKFVLAADRICQERSDAHCVLVGEGPESEMLQGMIRHSEFGDRIHLAGKWTNTEEVYPAFDILLQTSRSEAMPLAIIEAMACGLPVIALAVGGVAEIIEAATTEIHISPVEWPGVASPYPGDWPGIARAALDLLAKPERRKQMGGAGRQRVIELFNLTQNIPQVTGLFQRLVRDQGWRVDIDAGQMSPGGQRPKPRAKLRQVK